MLWTLVDSAGVQYGEGASRYNYPSFSAQIQDCRQLSRFGLGIRLRKATTQTVDMLEWERLTAMTPIRLKQ